MKVHRQHGSHRLLGRPLEFKPETHSYKPKPPGESAVDKAALERAKAKRLRKLKFTPVDSL